MRRGLQCLECQGPGAHSTTAPLLSRLVPPIPISKSIGIVWQHGGCHGPWPWTPSRCWATAGRPAAASVPVPRGKSAGQEAQWVLSGTGLTGPSVPVPVGATCYPLWNEPKLEGVPGVPAPVGAACLALLSNASVVSITSYGTTASG
jgi:hypothetical protein